MALPIGNLRQDYWAIVTLAAAELMRVVLLNTTFGSPYVGASYGVTGVPSPLRDDFTTATYGYFYLGLVVVCLIIAYLVVVWVSRSPFGRTLKRSEEHTSELQSLMRRSYAAFCLKKKK